MDENRKRRSNERDDDRPSWSETDREFGSKVVHEVERHFRPHLERLERVESNPILRINWTWAAGLIVAGVVGAFGYVFQSGAWKSTMEQQLEARKIMDQRQDERVERIEQRTRQDLADIKNEQKETNDKLDRWFESYGR
jgi:cytochrome c-type biogenesis protein CcmH/NrfG